MPESSAGRILREILEDDLPDRTATWLATAARLGRGNPSAVTRIIAGQREPQLETLAAIDGALRDAGVSEARRQAFLDAATEHRTGRRGFVQAAPSTAPSGGRVPVEPIAFSPDRPDLKSSSLRNAEAGIILDIREYSVQAASMLGPLVDPRIPGELLRDVRRNGQVHAHAAAAAASTHYGHALINVGSADHAARLLRQSQELIQGNEAKLQRVWEPWQDISGWSFDGFQLYSAQMLAVANRLVAEQSKAGPIRTRLLASSVHHLKRVRSLGGGFDPSMNLSDLLANALRDAAAAIAVIEPASQVVGRFLDESTERLSDSVDRPAYAMSRLKLAAWHAHQGTPRARQQLELNLREGLAASPEGPSVDLPNALNTAAEILASVDAIEAIRLAHRAQRLARQGGYPRELKQAELLIQQVEKCWNRST